ncbi:ROK family transcriptional regulator [Bifidobacterium cuniculi]|uniref:ROK family protein n=1 Tax=Bifidobacterium cuniculi TaxID=1688 RepID=A0A087B3G9_9BIFI|nr:ROK family transcriptional regulator [Bifidobacterium cuniculi]KFI65569.1 ROK family protein [Bifidobacterium cuniculi]
MASDTGTNATAEVNRARIVRHLYRHGVDSRAQIAKALGLTPAAITKITARLIDEGVLHETGDMAGTSRRRSIGVALDTAQSHVIGVKFARSLVEIGVFDLSGHALSMEELPPVDESGIEATLQLIHERIHALMDAAPAILAIGMAVPGPYLKSRGHTAVVSSMQQWRSVNFPAEFADAFAVPVLIEQDARAGALAQQLFSPGPGADSLAYYLLGEGVGLGVIEHGAIVDGADGAATEIGHISIDVAGRPCECGNVGCLERYCSAVAVHDDIDASGLVSHSASLSHRQAFAALCERAAAGNAEARALIAGVGTVVGYGAVTIVNAYNPSRIVVGDILAQAGEPLLDAIRAVLDERAIPELAAATEVTLSELPTDAAVTGAAAVAITHLLEHPSLLARS